MNRRQIGLSVPVAGLLTALGLVGTTLVLSSGGCGDLGWIEIVPEQVVAFRVENLTESTVQVNFAAGNGSPASSGGTDVTSQFDVRVPSGAATTGSAVCAQEYTIAAAHLETARTTYSEGGGDIFSGGGGVNYHAVVLTGDGTGTDGFDSNSIAVTRGRLLQRHTHFECDDVITVTITATNNQLELDGEGNPFTDLFGNPTIKYNVGSGFVTVTSGE